MATFCLSVHATYGCRHSGECCTNWTVPAEPHVVHAVGTLKIRPVRVDGAAFVPADPAAKGSRLNLARDAAGRCVFFDPDGGRLCRIHQSAGPRALPVACRHFPRVVLRDRRGTHVSLSHFCPTAAGMLTVNDPLVIVAAGTSLRLEEPVEGLDATGALPPLVRPGVLSDLDGYAGWERAGIGVLARSRSSFDEALEHLAWATDRIRDWQPGTCPMSTHVESVFRNAPPETAPDPDRHDRALATFRALGAGNAGREFDSVPDFENQWAGLVAPSIAGFDLTVRNFLAARLFGNWIAYQGRGLRSIVAWLRACAAAFRHYALKTALASKGPPTAAQLLHAIRMADLLMLHGLDSQEFARHVRSIEGPDPR